jgi:nucleoside-diphosphate-sugar epimerase
VKILVTGGSGRIGRYVVREMIQAGHMVTSVDVVHGVVPGVPSLLVDLTDAGQVYGAVARSQAKAIIHLGAWANDGHVPDTRTYGDNVCGTFNLFQASADLGVRRIVSASSCQVYGTAVAPPLYVPIDEDHPLRPAGAYALSKVVGEQTADYFVSRWGLEILSFRLMGVRTPDTIAAEIERNTRDPEAQKRLLWTRCDARDAALACRLAVEAASVDPGPYNITGRRILLDKESATLVARHYPDTEIREGLVGSLSPTSCVRAYEAFGYQARYDWWVGERHVEDQRHGTEDDV